MKSFRDFANLNTQERGANADKVTIAGFGAPNTGAETNGGAGSVAQGGTGAQGGAGVQSGTGVQGGAGSANDKVTAETLARQIAAAYRGKNDKAVLADIVSSAEKGKRAGTLTNAEIDAFYKRFAPMLNFVQRKKLEQIITQLKNI